MVARVAVNVLSSLAEYITPENLPCRRLVAAGALLHDIAKTQCLKGGCDHATEGARICRDLGYDDIAEIVAEHVLLRSFDTARYEKGRFFAKEIIYYSDKRVLHDCIVSLDERLEYILSRYGNDDMRRHQLIHMNFNACKELEQWLCRHSAKNPDSLLSHLDHGQPS